MTTSTCACPSHCPPEALSARQQKLAAERYRGLLTIDCNGAFRPQSPRSQPEGTIGTNLSKEVALEFAIAFNESAYAVRKNRWAVVTTNGALLLLPCDPDHRPPSPWMFHPAARELPGSDYETVLSMAADENAIRFEQSQIPRVWTVPLIGLQSTWLKREARRTAPQTPGEAAAVADWDAMLAWQPNPLAAKLVDLYLPVWTRIEDELPDGVGVGGAEAVQRGDDGKPFALDDERLYAEAEIRIDQALLYDLRGDIEGNVASALRDYAHELLDAAERLKPSGIGYGRYLAISGSRVAGRFPTLGAAGGFADGLGGCEVAEVMQAEPAPVAPGAEQHEAE